MFSSDSRFTRRPRTNNLSFSTASVAASWLPVRAPSSIDWLHCTCFTPGAESCTRCITSESSVLSSRLFPFNCNPISAADLFVFKSCNRFVTWPPTVRSSRYHYSVPSWLQIKDDKSVNKQYSSGPSGSHCCTPSSDDKRRSPKLSCDRLEHHKWMKWYNSGSISYTDHSITSRYAALKALIMSNFRMPWSSGILQM